VHPLHPPTGGNPQRPPPPSGLSPKWKQAPHEQHKQQPKNNLQPGLRVKATTLGRERDMKNEAEDNNPGFEMEGQEGCKQFAKLVGTNNNPTNNNPGLETGGRQQPWVRNGGGSKWRARRDANNSRTLWARTTTLGWKLGGWKLGGLAPRPSPCYYARSSGTTRPWTSVRRKRRPWNLNVSRSWSMPSRWRSVA